MFRIGTLWLLAIGSVSTLAAEQGIGQAPPYAQQPASGYTKPPVLSPWLNLGRSGSPSANYFYGVVPYENRGYDNALSPRVVDWERRTGSTAELDDLMPTLAGTGHPAGFMTMGPYFGSPLGNYNSAPRYNLSNYGTRR